MSEPYVPLQEANDDDKYKVCAITLLEPMLTILIYNITHSNEPSLLLNLIDMCLNLMCLFRKQMMVTIMQMQRRHTPVFVQNSTYFLHPTLP